MVWMEEGKGNSGERKRCFRGNLVLRETLPMTEDVRKGKMELLKSKEKGGWKMEEKGPKAHDFTIGGPLSLSPFQRV